MGVAVVSLLVLVIVGAIGGVVLSRVFAQAGARNEDAPGDEGGEDGSEQADLTEENKRSVRSFFGMSAAIVAILTDVLAVGALIGFAFFNNILVANSGLPIIFFALILAVAGYLLGARRLGLGAIVLTLAVGVLGAVVTIMLEGG